MGAEGGASLGASGTFSIVRLSRRRSRPPAMGSVGPLPGPGGPLVVNPLSFRPPFADEEARLREPRCAAPPTVPSGCSGVKVAAGNDLRPLESGNAVRARHFGAAGLTLAEPVQ